MNWAPPTFAAVLVGLGAVVAFTDPGPPDVIADSNALALASPTLPPPGPRPSPPSLPRLLGGASWLPTTLVTTQILDSVVPAAGLISALPLSMRANTPASESLIHAATERAEAHALAAVGAAVAAVADLSVHEPFASLRGALPRPVRGSVVAGFGPRPRRTTETQIRHMGLTFEVRPGAEVRSVARGIVAHVGRLRGYGGVVVVAHDSGYHTVYGQLGELTAAPGAMVEAGELLGRTGPASPDGGRRVYFELREDGVPRDPSGWLAASP